MRAWRAQSCLGDLRQVEYCCAALRKLRPEGKSPKDADGHAIEKSLLTTAILMYVRATHTAANGADRGAITLERGQLTKAQWDDHQALIQLRNQSVAHVNPEHISGDRAWHKVLLFAIRARPGVWQPVSASNETSFHLDTFGRLERMLPVAQSLVLVQFNKRMKNVTAMLNDASLSDGMLAQTAFNPVEAFGSISAATRIFERVSSPSSSDPNGQTDSFWYDE